jgi:predicted kinase
METLYIMVGCPGSGKSTIAKKMIEWYKENAPMFSLKYVSRDEIRFSIIGNPDEESKGEDEYFSRENEVWEKYVAEIVEGLESGKTVIADATHLNKKSRLKLLNAIREKNDELLHNTYISTVFVDTPLETCLKRNELRTGKRKVPRSSVRRMFYSIQKPIPKSEQTLDMLMVFNDKDNIMYSWDFIKNQYIEDDMQFKKEV